MIQLGSWKFYTDRHHVDNEEEAAAFINTHIKNNIIFITNVNSDNFEVDSTHIVGTKSFYEYK